jgi:hypothetical protein
MTENSHVLSNAWSVYPLGDRWSKLVRCSSGWVIAALTEELMLEKNMTMKAKRHDSFWGGSTATYVLRKKRLPGPSSSVHPFQSRIAYFTLRGGLLSAFQCCAKEPWLVSQIADLPLANGAVILMLVKKIQFVVTVNTLFRLWVYKKMAIWHALKKCVSSSLL